MPPRLNKRQQRELEELEALGKASNVEEPSSEEEAEIIPVKPAGGFAALFSADSEEEAPESEADEKPQPTKNKKSKKKKKKKVAAVIVEAEAAPETPGKSQKSTGQTKVATKKGKGKEKAPEKDDLDQALAELSQKLASGPEQPTMSSANQTLASLLSVSLVHLDSDAEMRKFFGSKVVSAAKSSTTGSPGGSRTRQVGAQKSHLTRPQPSWWAAKQREGLSIRQYDQDDVEDKLKRLGWAQAVEEKWWTVEYTKRYKSVTLSFIQAVNAGDPEAFWRILQKLPWHGDTLLQLAEVYRHREEYSQAVDFTERALFTYERSFVGAFNFTGGMNRLDFDRVENRPFFLALHRQVTDLQRRGCYRTAFEFARLLYSLDPWSDPHGALCHLDYLAIRCGMGAWLLEMWELFDGFAQDKSRKNRVNVNFLPGWAYAKALALRAQEDAKKDKIHDASDAALKDAILAFPEIVPLLADKADIKIPDDIRSNSRFKILTEGSLSSSAHNFLHLLSHLYAQRSSPLWKDAKRASWLAKTAASVVPQADWDRPQRKQFFNFYEPIGPRYSMYRQITILETSYRSLFAFIPREILNVKQLACDPLPPQTATNVYDAEFFKGVEDVFSIRHRTRQDAAGDQRLLERLIPDPVFLRQLQPRQSSIPKAFFNAHPGFAERFPGGIVQFAQMAGEMPEDQLEDIMIAEAENLPQNLGMPGGFEAQFAAEFTSDEEEGEGAVPRLAVPDDAEGSDRGREEQNSEEEEVAPMPVRMIRNVMNRFWGGNTAAAEDTSEDEAHEAHELPIHEDGGD
ncbi:DUF654-domain-containing protein [Athelia psychrophila]|uniref:DUF654-domain-containing protein n=1 Tax=Athelia psychrophila TaxID=1759441 RepID=A0A167XII1_9AGAM|nr:DUF654-domain-containing protein [Fibularhizoctonia sp. CBS 109695]